MEYADGATPLEPDEIAGLLHKHISTRGELDHLEQANIQEGLLWLGRQKGTDILNGSFAKKLHYELFAQVWQWAGDFRLTEKNIGIAPINVAVSLRDLFDDIKFWIDHAVYDPIEIIARFHHKLVFIHAFPNGNGRHARILSDHILEKIFKLPPIDWAAGKNLASMPERRKEYIAALREADKGNFNLLLQFMVADKQN